VSRVNRGRGWEDEGPTAPVEQWLPDDVRMPYRVNGLREYTGVRYRELERQTCSIDKRPSEIGQTQADDVTDRSSHGGALHIWNVHPKAKHDEFMSADGVLVTHPWVADPKSKQGFRAINIEEVTLPPDCANHLPEGAFDGR